MDQDRKVRVTTVQDSVTLKIKLERDDSDNPGRNEINVTSDYLERKVLDEPIVDSVKTVLVPVRDLVTKEVKNMLVPVEVRDETGLNVIKSVLIPFEGDDGLVSYELKKVMVPIKPELSLRQRKGESRFATSQAKDRRSSCKGGERKRKRSEEGVLEGGKEMVLEERMEVDEVTKESKLKTDVKGEVDEILDTLRNVCPFCEKCFKDEEQMQKHALKTHKKPYNCDKCHKGYFSDLALEEHRKTHEVVYFHRCSVCQMQYKTVTGLKHHRIREHTDIDPKFICDCCGKKFKLKLDLALHIDRSHMNATYICRFCGMAVKNIAHHETKHQENKEIVYTYCCTVCPRKFKAWNTLENHLLMKHKASNVGTDMLRTLCQKRFQSRSDFYQHVLLNQTDVKQHKCDACGKTFTSEYNLRNHVALHSQTYACTQCDKNFTTNYLLKLHLRKHTGERPYQCKVCLKTFARSASLRMHRLIHTGEKPYACDLCGQSFTQRGSMMSHRRKHPENHPPPPPPPPLLLTDPENNEH